MSAVSGSHQMHALAGYFVSVCLWCNIELYLGDDWGFLAGHAPDS